MAACKIAACALLHSFVPLILAQTRQQCSLTAPSNGYVKLYQFNGQSFAFASDLENKQSTYVSPAHVAEFKCKDGYTLVGDPALTCTLDRYRNADWSARIPDCIASTCFWFNPLAHFEFYYNRVRINSKAVEFPIGTILSINSKVLCELSPDEFELLPSENLACMPNGMWSNLNPICALGPNFCKRASIINEQVERFSYEGKSFNVHRLQKYFPAGSELVVNMPCPAEFNSTEETTLLCHGGKWIVLKEQWQSSCTLANTSAQHSSANEYASHDLAVVGLIGWGAVTSLFCAVLLAIICIFLYRRGNADACRVDRRGRSVNSRRKNESDHRSQFSVAHLSSHHAYSDALYQAISDDILDRPATNYSEAIAMSSVTSLNDLSVTIVNPIAESDGQEHRKSLQENEIYSTVLPKSQRGDIE